MKLKSYQMKIISLLHCSFQHAKLEGSVRNTGTHACGVIITPRTTIDLIPMTTSKDSDLLVTQFDNSVVENAGFSRWIFLD